MCLTYEELATLLTHVEARLNSRPLGPLSKPEDGYEALTPGHFLIGKPIEALPDSLDARNTGSLVRCWRLCQKLTTDFWKHWSNTHLSQLLKLSKRKTATRHFKVGDLVYIRGQNLAPAKRPLARVVQTHPGEDGLVRVATVHTSKGIYKCPLMKLVLLVIEEETS